MNGVDPNDEAFDCLLVAAFTFAIGVLFEVVLGDRAALAAAILYSGTFSCFALIWWFT